MFYAESVPRKSPLVIGHRGAPGYRPEHSRSSYELALAMGVDAVEPDVVATKDGVLIVRHENEISGTTDVAEHPEFADRKTTKRVDGQALTGWFSEDFTWAELSTLRATERLGPLRQASASFDGRYPVIRLRELFEIIDDAAEASDRVLKMVAEFKHAAYFDGIGLPPRGADVTGEASASVVIAASGVNPLDRKIRSGQAAHARRAALAQQRCQCAHTLGVGGVFRGGLQGVGGRCGGGGTRHGQVDAARFLAVRQRGVAQHVGIELVGQRHQTGWAQVVELDIARIEGAVAGVA